jgi:hypothetical protein
MKRSSTARSYGASALSPLSWRLGRQGALALLTAAPTNGCGRSRFSLRGGSLDLVDSIRQSPQFGLVEFEEDARTFDATLGGWLLRRHESGLDAASI